MNLNTSKHTEPNILIECYKQIGIALLYLLCGYIVHHNFTHNNIISTAWPGSGLALGVLLIGGKRYILGVILGALSLTILTNDSLWAIGGITLAITLEALLGVWLITRNDHSALSLHTLRDYLWLIVAGGGIAGIVGAVIGGSSILLAGYITPVDYFASVVHWWMGDMLGVVLVTPFILAWYQEKRVPFNAKQLLEGLLLISMTFLVGQMVFMDRLYEPPSDGYVIFFCVAWVAIRMGSRGVTFIILLIATQAMWGAHLGIGIFAHDIARASSLNFWFCFLILSVVGMALATYVDEIKRALSVLQLKDNALNAVANGIVITDVAGRVEWVNQAFSRITGFSLNDAYGLNPRELVKSGKQDDAYYQSMWETILAKKVWHGDLINRRKDGTLYHEEMTITPLVNEQGEIIHFVAVKREITARKQMETALRESEYRWKFAVEGSGDGLWDWSVADGTVIFTKRWKEMLGFAEDEIGNGFEEWEMRIHPDDKMETLAAVQAYLGGKIPVYSREFRISCKDGSYKWILSRGTVVSRNTDGNPLRIIGTHSDITERKQAQETIVCLNKKLEEKISTQNNALASANLSLIKKVDELRRSKHQLMEREAKLNSIFNASVEGIITTNSSDLIIFANAAVATIFGYKPEQLMGCGINKLMPSTYRNTSVKLAGQIQEVEGLHKNGSVVPLDLSIAEFSVENEPYLTHIVRDVSLRKHREQQDKEHLDELAHITRLGLMGEMASGIAHEVNQPLAAIASYTQASINLINMENSDQVKLTEILYKTQQEALRAGRIIHRMREFVKSHTNHCSSTDINTLIHNAVGLCMAELKQNAIKLTLGLDDNLPLIHVDQVQIEQVLINLIRNSVDALQNLPVNKQPHLTIHSHLVSNNVIRVRVKDNGAGLNEDQKQKILTPFYTTKANGMGMGLSISRSLIQAHEGTLNFNSKLGKGTTFYFTLPVESNSVIIQPTPENKQS
ncbi:MAG: PAS domain S-box protein [Methylobacter sp.]